MEIRDLAIVLKVVPFEERHQIVTALSEKHGKISAIARNSIQSRRFGGALQLFVASDWRCIEKNGSPLLSLREATVRHVFRAIAARYERMTHASLMSEILLRVAPPGEPATDLFRLYINALTALEETTEADEARVLTGFMIKVLQWAGCQPRLGSCLKCQTPLSGHLTTVSMAIENAGWYCPDTCASGSTQLLSSLALCDVVLAMNLPIRKAVTEMHASPHETQNLLTQLSALLQYHVPGLGDSDLRTLKWVVTG